MASTNKNKTRTFAKKKQPNTNKKFITKFLFWFWGLFLAGILAFTLLFILTIYGFWRNAQC